MKDIFLIGYEAPRALVTRILRPIVGRDPDVLVNLSAESIVTHSESCAHDIMHAFAANKVLCGLTVTTRYDKTDALAGVFGIVALGPHNTFKFKPRLREGSFDFSSGCPRCGLGAAQIRPYVLNDGAKACRRAAYATYESERLFFREDVAREIVAATGQPWCMRYPVDARGKVSRAWMEAVPCATMPPLSRASTGVLFGSTASGVSMGEAPEVIAPCAACGREIWDYDFLRRPRLVYSKAAAEAGARHAIVSMHEPWVAFPEFDPVTRRFGSLIGMPWLLFNRSAIEVLLRYSHGERDAIASIEPVYSE